ncbi:MAG: ChaN family lipoprotein [Selenomonadales bacterium]|nr:ChaN family lipoprotein [Selenomonadales bacterium]
MISKLKRTLCMASLLCLAMVPTCGASGAPDAYFYTNGKSMDAAEAATHLAGYDVVLFGEYHDQRAIHIIEDEFLRAMHKLQPKLAVSMEMLERDGAKDFERYMTGDITEEKMRETVRLWPNWDEDYRPMAEFARENGLDVISSNIPRYLAAHYAKNGTLDGIAEADRQYLPAQHIIEKNAYYDHFSKVMSTPKGPMKITGEMLDRYYGAQCLKDDTMAESIALYLDAHPSVKVVHYQGSFHGNHHLGVAEKLAKLRPELKIAVIAPADSIDETKDRNEELFCIFVREAKQ